jgi:hypothetical protein
MQGSDPVTGKMPVPQVLLLKWKHYIICDVNYYRALPPQPVNFSEGFWGRSQIICLRLFSPKKFITEICAIGLLFEDGFTI